MTSEVSSLQPARQHLFSSCPAVVPESCQMQRLMRNVVVHDCSCCSQPCYKAHPDMRCWIGAQPGMHDSSLQLALSYEADPDMICWIASTTCMTAAAAANLEL